MMQILLTKTISTRETTKLLLQHLLFEVVIHGLQAFTTYAFRRTRLPLRKALHVDLMNAFTSLPYDMMMDKQIMHQFRKVVSTLSTLILGRVRGCQRSCQNPSPVNADDRIHRGINLQSHRFDKSIDIHSQRPAYTFVPSALLLWFLHD
jgi:hypothetical protein